ncbi:MAG: septation protein A [Rhodothermales bacterium]|nr:septation protein A [Rhodothermales bacterium]
MTPTPQAVSKMQLIVDLFPIILFFVVYSVYDSIYLATAALMGAMGVQIAIQWIKHRTVSKMLLISGGVVVLFGGATLVLREPIFIQWKPTIANWLFALAFLVSRYVGDKTLIQRMLGEAVELPVAAWRQLNWFWISSFTLLGAANIYVVYNYSEETWVRFKLASIIVFTLVSMIATAFWIWKYLPKETQSES